MKNARKDRVCTSTQARRGEGARSEQIESGSAGTALEGGLREPAARSCNDGELPGPTLGVDLLVVLPDPATTIARFHVSRGSLAVKGERVPQRGRGGAPLELGDVAPLHLVQFSICRVILLRNRDGPSDWARGEAQRPTLTTRTARSCHAEDYTRRARADSPTETIGWRYGMRPMLSAWAVDCQ